MIKNRKGSLIYSMPITKLEKMRNQLKILIPFNAIFILILYGLPLHSLVFENNYLAFLVGWSIASGLVGIMLILSTPLTLHNQLIIYENGIIPLRRPFRSLSNELIYIGDISKIKFKGMKEAETEIYEFEIYDKKGRIFRVSSLVLSRYEKNEKNAKKVYEALMNFKTRINK